MKEIDKNITYGTSYKLIQVENKENFNYYLEVSIILKFVRI